MRRSKHIGIVAVAAAVLVIFIGIFSFFVGDRIESALTGRAISMAYIIYTPPGNCSMELHQGLNLVSFNCQSGAFGPSDVLVDANNNSLPYASIFEYSPQNRNDSWKSYNPSLPSWVMQDLDIIDRRHGYWLIMNQDAVYFTDGLQFASTNIGIPDGWSLIGYPSDKIRNISVQLGTLTNTTTRIQAYKYFNGTPTWIYWNNDTGGNLSNFEPMAGYWIYSTINTTLDVIW